jgi:hypothetical protein
MRKTIYGTLLASVGSLALVAGGMASAPVTEPPAEKALDASAVAIFKGVTRVEVYRISYNQQGEPGKGLGLKNYKILEQGKEPSRQLVDRLTAVVLDPASYRVQPGCYPRVAIRLLKGQESVLVFHCPDCGRLRVEWKDGAGKVHVLPGYATALIGIERQLIKESFGGKREFRF